MSSKLWFCPAPANTIAVVPDDDKPKPVSIPPSRLPLASRAYKPRIHKMNRGVRVYMGTYSKMTNGIPCHPVGVVPPTDNTLIRLNRKTL